MLNIKIEVQGLQHLGRLAETEHARMARAITRAVIESGDKVKAGLYVDTTSALGPRMGQTWKVGVYPKAGGPGAKYNSPVRPSAAASALVFTKADDIVHAFLTGATIRPLAGKYLAIPTSNVRKDRDGHRMNPASFAEAGIELRFVPAGQFGRYPVLVADDFKVGFSRRRGEAHGRRVLRAGRGTQTVVMFTLIPSAQMRKLLDLDRRAAEAGSDLQTRIERYLGDAP
mgnify:CR=1 FL=1